MSVRKEMWLPAIEDNFFANWSLLEQLGKNDSVYVDNKTVHIPNAGLPGTILKNNSVYPVQVNERTDTTVSYDMASYQLPPVRVGKYDTAALTYDKAASVIKDHMGGIGERIMFEMFNAWYPGKVAGKFVETTGDLKATHAPGSTGTRKAITIEDVEAAALILDLQKVPDTDRILLLDPVMFYQLAADIRKSDNSITIIENDGLKVLSQEFMGFKVVKVHRVGYSTAAGTIRDIGNAGAATDVAFAYAYQKDQVSLAKIDGAVVYDNSDRAEYYGDIISAEAWAGGLYRRFDKKGIVPIFGIS
jgi:hypothetical protein